MQTDLIFVRDIMKKLNILLLLCILLFINHYAQCIVIGSNTILSRQPTAYFPTSDTDNTMLGFALFDNGFFLEDLSTSCTFDSFYLLNGTSGLNGGTLSLNQQLSLGAKFSPVTTGHIIGNGNALTFPATSTQITFPMFGLLSTNSLSKGFQFLLPNSIQSLDISNDDKYIAIGMKTSPNPELLMYTFKNKVIVPTSLAPLGGKFGTTINDIKWHPTTNHLAVCRNDKKFSVFQKTDTTFTLNAEINLGAITPTSCLWDPSGTYVMVSTNDYHNALISYLFTPETHTLILSANKDIPAGLTVVPQSIRFSPSGNYLAVGLNKSPQESYVYLYLFTAGWLDLVASVQVNDTIANISFDDSETYLAVTSSRQTLVNVFKYDQTTLQPQITIPETPAGYAAHWDTLGYYLDIAGTEGNPQELFFNAPDYCPPLMPLFSNGTYIPILGYIPFHWAHDETKFIAGTVDKALKYYHVVQKPFTLENLQIEIPTNMKLSSPLNIKGNCIITGSQGNAQLTLTDQASINIFPNSSLTFENIQISNVHDSNIKGTDQTSNLTLNQASFILDGNFTFSYGSLTINKESAINGKDKRFAYTSSCNISVLENAMLSLGQGVTFFYNPISGKPDLITFANHASGLRLSEAHLAVGTSGLKLLGGMLIADVTAYLDGTPGSDLYTIEIGNDSSDSDFQLYIMPVTKLICTSGRFWYRNVNISEASYSSHILSVLRMNPGIIFKYNTIRASSGGFEISSSASRIPVGGALLYGDTTIF